MKICKQCYEKLKQREGLQPTAVVPVDGSHTCDICDTNRDEIYDVVALTRESIILPKNAMINEVYSWSNDITTIFKDYYDEDKDVIVATICTGFYYGEPNESDTELYNDDPVAIYD